MRIAGITIRAFRGFNAETRLAFGNTNVFAGPNGFGKTSLFDAVQWCLFGDVERLSGTRDFVRAADIYTNKFSTDTCSVALDFEDGGRRLSRRRTLTQCSSQIDGRNVSDSTFLEALGLLEKDSSEKFLRYFLLQQERINDFVKDLNPRNRYNALVSFLEFRTPDKLSTSLQALQKQVEQALEDATVETEVAQHRQTTLESDIAELTEAKTTFSAELIQAQFQRLVQDSRVVLPRYADFPSDDALTMEGIPAFAAALSAALRETRGVAAILMELHKTQEQVKLEDDTVDTRIAELTSAVASAEEKIKSNETELNLLMTRLDSVLTKLADAGAARTRLISVLSEVKVLVSSDVCPVCQQPIERSKLLRRIDQSIEAEPKEIAEATQTRIQIQTSVATLRNTNVRLASELESERRQLEELQEVIKHRALFTSSTLKLQSHPLIGAMDLRDRTLRSIAAAVPHIQEQLENLEQRAVKLLQLLETVNATSLLPQKQGELGDVQKKLAESAKRMQDWAAVAATMGRCLQEISTLRQRLVADLLELNKPLIRNLYKRLQPHPLFTEIDFEVQTAYKEAELYFRVYSRDHAADAYPSTVFSASQLNALAVCIFIALSLRARGPLSVLMMDDPIFSMDDINVLGLCDLMRQLKPQRQLFISTHSYDFYRLLLSKLRPLSSEDHVKGFRFEGWSQAGPVIREDVADFLDQKIDLRRIKAFIGPSAA
jgi:DNA repair exonuclease SbcCD ATPase subunit